MGAICIKFRSNPLKRTRPGTSQDDVIFEGEAVLSGRGL